MAVAGGPRNGARTSRPDSQRPAGIDRGDAASAGADLGNVNDGNSQQVAVAAHQAAAR